MNYPNAYIEYSVDDVPVPSGMAEVLYEVIYDAEFHGQKLL